MSNFYDLETDLDVEDVDNGEDENFEDISEFAPYDEEDAETRWGSLDFEDLVGELENYVATAKKFFFSKKKRIVNGEEITHLVQYIRQKLPGEISESRSIISNRDSIISNAHREENRIVTSAKEYYNSTTQKANDDAEKIISRAQAQAEEMVASHSITQAARVRAEEIKENCQKEMNAFIAKTNADCEAHKKAARDWAAGTTQGSYNFICEALSQYQAVAMNNLNQITEVYKKFQSGYEEQMKTLQADKRVAPEGE